MKVRSFSAKGFGTAKRRTEKRNVEKPQAEPRRKRQYFAGEGKEGTKA